MNIRSFAASVGAWILVAAPVHAIPQNFSSGGAFQLRAGVPFERFAAEKETWREGGALKGEWSEPDKAGMQTLKDDAVVFGLPAMEIKAERSISGVQRFLVVFRDERRNAGKGLFDRVTKNVQAFTGDRGKPATKTMKGGQTFHYGDGVLITVRNRAAGEVEVEFRPGP